MAERLTKTDDLFASVLNGTASERVISELNRVLRSDETHRRRFMQMTRINIALRESYNASPIMTGGGRVDSDSIVLDARIEEEPATKRTRFFSAPYAVAASLLLVGVVAVIAYMTLRPTPPTNPYATIPFATVVDSTGSLFVDDDPGVRGRRYTAGVYEIPSGTADMLLSNLVGVRLRGQSRLSMHSPMAASLSVGEATFNCPPQAKGYTVYLPGNVRIIDLGTRFRVSVNEDGASHVTVIEGTVSLRRGEGEAVILEQAASASVSSDPAESIVVDEHPSILADAALWLKADSITGTDDGGAITLWEDASKNEHAAMAKLDQQPVYVAEGINGLPSVRFDGTQHMKLPTTGDLGIVTGDYEIFIVARTDRAEGQFLLAAATPQGIGQYELHVNHPWLDVGYNFLPSTGVHLTTGKKTQYVGSAHVFAARIVDGVAYAVVDGDTASAASGPETSPRLDLPLVLGARGSGGLPLIGDVAEVLIYNAVLKEDQRTQVLEYLQTKYGLATQADTPSHSGDVR